MATEKSQVPMIKIAARLVLSRSHGDMMNIIARKRSTLKTPISGLHTSLRSNLTTTSVHELKKTDVACNWNRRLQFYAARKAFDERKNVRRRLLAKS